MLACVSACKLCLYLLPFSSKCPISAACVQLPAKMRRKRGDSVLSHFHHQFWKNNVCTCLLTLAESGRSVARFTCPTWHFTCPGISDNPYCWALYTCSDFGYYVCMASSVWNRICCLWLRFEGCAVHIRAEYTNKLTNYLIKILFECFKSFLSHL